jgi:hypothetical protein
VASSISGITWQSGQEMPISTAPATGTSSTRSVALGDCAILAGVVRRGGADQQMPPLGPAEHGRVAVGVQFKGIRYLAVQLPLRFGVAHRRPKASPQTKGSALCGLECRRPAESQA